METRKMDMPLPAHAQLTEVRDYLSAQTGRKGFTYGEAVVEACERFWETERQRAAAKGTQS